MSIGGSGTRARFAIRSFGHVVLLVIIAFIVSGRAEPRISTAEHCRVAVSQLCSMFMVGVAESRIRIRSRPTLPQLLVCQLTSKQSNNTILYVCAGMRISRDNGPADCATMASDTADWQRYNSQLTFFLISIQFTEILIPG